MDITHATVPLDSANHQAAPARQGTEKRAQPALWNTTEFHIYYFLFALSILSMLWTTTGFSSRSFHSLSLPFGLIRMLGRSLTSKLLPLLSMAASWLAREAYRTP